MPQPVLALLPILASPGTRRGLGLAISAAGLLALVLGGLQAAELRGRLGPSRLLIGPTAVVAAPDGRVLVASPTFSRMHVYDASGRPLRTWQVPAEGGPFRIALAAPDRLRVAPERTGTLLEYDLQGELLGHSPRAAAFEELAREDEGRFVAEDGTRYAIEAGRIVRRRGPEERVLVEGFPNHGALNRAMAQVVALLLVGVAALLGGILATARRQRPAREAAGEPGA